MASNFRSSGRAVNASSIACLGPLLTKTLDPVSRNEPMSQLCYLCGQSIAQGEGSKDHTVSKHLVAGRQPKVKGFDYGRSIPAHVTCNNRFGPERYCATALRLVEVLHDDDCVTIRQHRDDPSVRIMAVNADCLKGLSKRDLRFFKFIDARDKSAAELSEPSFFSGKPQTNPIRDALFVALAVLTKSAAALLLARHLPKVPATWRVLAIPYGGATDAIDLDEELGPRKPFAAGVKAWFHPFESGDWFVVYRARTLLVWFLFWLSESDDAWQATLGRFSDAERLYFEGRQLNDLIDYQWQRV